MRKLLYISYYFPPQACAASQRCRKLTKYLSHYGWEPVVFTVDENPALPVDPTLLADIGGARLVRVPLSPFVKGLITLKPLRLALNKCLLPDQERLWLPALRQAINRALKNERFDAVLTSCSPFSQNLEGERLKDYYQLPWVTDFRDGWTLGSAFDPLTPFHRWVHKRLEARALERCDHWIANTPGLLEAQRAQNPVVREKSSCIPNGFDPEDFAGVAKEHWDSSVWNLVYVGAWYRKLYPDSLFKSLAAFRQARPEIRLTLHYLGPHFTHFAAAAERSGLEDLTRDHGYPPHAEAISYMKSADLLLMALPSDARARYWVPAKLHEYLASGVPIFGVCPQGDAFDLVSRGGEAVEAGKADAASAGARALSVLWEQRSSHTSKKPASIAEFEYTKLAERLASVLDRVAGIRR